MHNVCRPCLRRERMPAVDDQWWKGCSGRLGRCEVESDGCGDAETIIAAKDGPSALLSAVFKGSTVALALEWPALRAVYAREI